jgi:hypothetical protein
MRKGFHPKPALWYPVIRHLSRLIGFVPLVLATHMDFLHAIWHCDYVWCRKRPVRTQACNRS